MNYDKIQKKNQDNIFSSEKLKRFSTIESVKEDTT